LNNEFFEIADNIGYSLLSVFIYFSLRPSKSFNLFLLSFIFIVILFTFKRGAILSAGLGYAAFTIYNFGNLKSRKLLALPLFLGLFMTGVIIVEFRDQILYRFIYDVSAGSGRGLMYGKISGAWIGADGLSIIFGHGFFTVKNILGGKYAHSDWFELMYDHGLIGMIFYAVVIISFILTRKYIRREMMPAFITIITVWLLKSIFSGVYMDRGFYLFFACIGLLLGSTHRKIETDNLKKIHFQEQKSP
jgi:hypothetical protein